ncbi:hypothetical protein D3C72_547380 [compost metagenome]
MVLQMMLTCSSFQIRGTKEVMVNPNTGNKEDKILTEKLGSCFSSMASSIAIISSCEDDLMFLRRLENNNPAIKIVGIAIKTPYTNTKPISAFNKLLIPIGEGCGGKNPCATEREANMGIPK